MARKKKHEEHANHEAWAIPYADLMTLLLAFFVVMYAISSLNEGKYKVMSEALNSAFGGTPRSPHLIKFQSPPTSALPPAPITPGLPGTGQDMLTPPAQQFAVLDNNSQQQLNVLADDIEHALGDLIRENLIVVRRAELWLEVEINSDILFASGSAFLETDARDVLQKVAKVLASAKNQIRIEGYTDNRPIHTAQFPSNWELSAARAASVVHLFSDHQIGQERLSMVGFGEYRPLAENTTPEGQRRNRRVILVVLASSDKAPMPQFLTHNGRTVEVDRAAPSMRTPAAARTPAIAHKKAATDVALSLPAPTPSRTPESARSAPLGESK